MLYIMVYSLLLLLQRQKSYLNYFDNAAELIIIM